jgi:hypothetical protein
MSRNVVKVLGAAAVNPEVLQVVLLGSFRAKLDLGKANLLHDLPVDVVVLCRIGQVTKRDFLVVCFPYMRKYGILETHFAGEPFQAEAAVVGVNAEKIHAEGLTLQDVNR